MKKNITSWGVSGIGHFTAFTLLYYIAVVIGLEIRIGNVALIWPANGIAFCFFIIRPKREWPIYIVGLSLGYIAVMHTTGDYPWSIIIGILFANIIQTVVGAWLVKRYVPAPNNFSSIREIIVTLFFTALVGSFASALLSVSLLDAGFMETPWQLWLSGIIDNAGSTVVMLPFMLVFINTFSPAEWLSSNWQRWLEGLVLSLITIVLARYIFSLSYPTDVLMRTLPYLLIPCILWAGLRFGQQGVTLGTLFIAAVVVRHTLLNEGPFAMDGSSGSGFIQVLTVHMYISAVAITGLIVAALMKQQVIAMQSLAGGIAHEMRNPLGFIRYSLKSIRDNLAAARSGKLPASSAATMRGAVDSAEKAIQRSLQVIELTLNSIYKKEIDTTQFDYLSAQACVEKAIDEYSFYSLAERNKITLDIGQDFIFKGDETLFIHVLFNLLKNALYYLANRPSGNVTIRVESTHGINRIVVRDNGPGISAQARQHLFDNFFTVGKKGGTGLGLAYCKRVMQSFAGDIQCESTEGEYTSFILSFPTISRTDIVTYQQKQLAALEGRQILIIDDDTEFISQLLHSLPENNLVITLVDDIQIAFLEMKKQNFDLVVMDTNTQGMNGLEGIRWIRDGAIFSTGECVNYQTIPIVVFSDEAKTGARENALAAGATGFISKTCQTMHFIQGLRAAIAVGEKQAVAFQAQGGLRNLTILVVDDERINRAYLKKILEPQEIRVLEAEGGESALALLEQNHCDVVITDLQMPGMDGWQLATAIRAGQAFHEFQEYASIPIIAISGNPRQVRGQRCLETGINTYLTKPVEEKLLLGTLSKQLKRYASEGNENRADDHQQEDLERVGEAIDHDDDLAKLLHDIVTPTLMLEKHIKLLEQHLPTLIECYHLQGKRDNTNKALSEAVVENLQTASHTMARIMRTIQQKQALLRSRYESTQSLEDELVELFVQDIDLFWQWIATLQSTCVAPYLPVLLAVYEQMPAEDLPAELLIENKAWQGLNCTVTDCAKAVSRAGKCLGRYEETKHETEINKAKRTESIWVSPGTSEGSG